jgi:hypothetical protein
MWLTEWSSKSRSGLGARRWQRRSAPRRRQREEEDGSVGPLGKTGKVDFVVFETARALFFFISKQLPLTSNSCFGPGDQFDARSATKECNYKVHVGQVSSSFTKFIITSIIIYVFK